MREFGSSSLSLAGSILIAHPGLLDPSFRRSVIFLSTNDPEEGSFGLILNRPSGRTVGDVLSDQNLGKLRGVPVLIGGPVASDQLIFASFRWHPEDRRVECHHHLALEQARDAVAVEHLIVRAFIGYGGWSKGQLEAELSQHAWLVGKAEREILRLSRAATLWREVITPFGPHFQLAAEAPDDPSLN